MTARVKHAFPLGSRVSHSATTPPLSPAELRQLLRYAPDFPKPGIRFCDLTPLFANPRALRSLVDMLAERCEPLAPKCIVGIEARGFLLGTPLAYAMGVGFVPVRKPGKLPGSTHGVDYPLEYGMDRLEIQDDALVPGQAVLVVDDLLATGGTAAACTTLVESLGAQVCGYGFIVELEPLSGRRRLNQGVPCQSLLIHD